MSFTKGRTSSLRRLAKDLGIKQEVIQRIRTIAEKVTNEMRVSIQTTKNENTGGTYLTIFHNGKPVADHRAGIWQVRQSAPPYWKALQSRLVGVKTHTLNELSILLDRIRSGEMKPRVEDLLWTLEDESLRAAILQALEHERAERKSKGLSREAVRLLVASLGWDISLRRRVSYHRRFEALGAAIEKAADTSRGERSKIYNAVETWLQGGEPPSDLE